MKSTSMHKRVGAVLLCLSLLCGMVFSTLVLPTAAEDDTVEVSKFKADFSELAAIATEAEAFGESTYYRPGYKTNAADIAISEWVDEKFDMVSGYGKSAVRTYLGQSSSTLTFGSKDTWSGENYWNVFNDGSIKQTTLVSGQMLRLVEAFVPKYEGKQAVLSNFEAKMTFAVGATGSQGQGFVIAFHEDKAGYVRVSGDHRLQDSGSMVVVGNGGGSYLKNARFGMSVYDQNNTLGTDGAKVYASAAGVTPNEKGGTTVNGDGSSADLQALANLKIDGEMFAEGNDLAVGTKYDLIVKVVGTALTATVKETATGTVVYTREKTLEAAGSGYISFGSSNGNNKIYAIEVTELDENGNAVDFGTQTGTDKIETLKIDFADVPEVQWYNGAYYYNAGYDTSDVTASVDMETDFLTKGSSSYTVNTQEKMLTDYLESKLAFYYSQEGNTFERTNVNGYAVSDAGVEYTAKTGDVNAYAPDTKVSLGKYVDGIGFSGNSGNGIAKWYLDSNEWLAYTNNNKTGDGMFRKSGSIAFKDKNGELLQIDNFKLDLDFKMYADGTYDHSNIAVGFHANQPYLERARTTQALFAISPYGGYFLGDDYAITTGETYKMFNKSTGTYDDYTATADKSFIANHNLTHSTTSTRASVWPCVATKIGHSVEAHLTLTVVGATATAKVTVGDTVILEETETLSTYYGSGYLFLSGANQQGWYKNIEVTRLDVNGNPVDFSDDNEGFTFGESFDAKATYYYKDSKFWRNTGADMFWMAGGNATYYNFDDPTTYAVDKATVDHLNKKFDFWAYREGNQVKLTEPYQTTEDVLTADTYLDGATSRWYYSKEGLTMNPSKTGGGEALRKGMTLSPKMNGELIKARNVELYTDVVLTYDYNNYSLMNITLRSKEAGTVINGNNTGNNKYVDHLALQVRPDGINVVDGAKVGITTAEITNADGYTAWSDDEKHYNVRVYAKAVNNKLTVKVTDDLTGATLYEVTDKTVSYVEEGYINVSTGQAWATVANLYVNVLEDTMQPTFEAKYSGLFAYGSATTADERIPAYLRQNTYPNGADYFGVWSNGYDHADFLNVHNTFATADGYQLVTEGEVTYLKDSENAVVLSTEEAWIDGFVLDEEAGTISITRNQEYLNQIVKDLTQEFYDYLNGKFDAYYIDTAVYKGTGVEDNGWGSEVGSVYVNTYLQFKGLSAAADVETYMKEDGHTPIDQHISLLVPKNPNGKAMKGSEFSMNFRVRLNDSKNYGTAYIGFNMPTVGRIGVAETSNGVITPDADVNVIKINTTEFKFWNGTEWVDLVSEYTGYNLYADIALTVLDGKLTGSVKFENKTAQTFEVALTNTDAGYLAIGQNGGSVNFGTLDLHVYDVVSNDHECDFTIPNYDESGHWNECACGEKTEVVGHTMNAKYDATGEWTECACGYKTEVTAHQSETARDAEGHWTVCACGYATDKVAHDYTESDLCACGYQKDNTAVVDGNTITVKADEGYQLKAGSLIVTDANGNDFVPQRVGYRDGGDATQYEVVDTSAVAPFTVKSAEFYQPGTETGYNMGLVGTSVHTDDSGLRFIHRLNIDKDGNMLYNGEKVKVTEYGLLLASGPILSNPEDLDIETADESMHVHQYKWPAEEKYYDVCDDHVDIAIHVKNIAIHNGQNTDLITRTYIILEDGTTVYGDVAVSTYNKAAGLA